MTSPRVLSPTTAASKRQASAAPKLPSRVVQASTSKAGPASTAKATSARKSKVLAYASAKSVSLADGRKAAGTTASGVSESAVLSYLTLFRATPLERIDVIRRGVPASEAKRMFAELAIAQGAGLRALNLSAATVNKKAKQGARLSPEESERIVGFAKLVGQLEALIQESGDPANFDARAWMARWLSEPLPAFGGARPADLVDTMEGQSLVSAALARIQSGAYG